mgnify:CR=1 FL=1
MSRQIKSFTLTIQTNANTKYFPMVLFFPGIYVFRVTKNWKTPTVCNGEPHQKRHWSEAISLLPVHSLRLQAEQKLYSQVEPQIPKIVHYLDPNERDPELCCFGGEARKSFQISYVTALRIRWKEMAYSCISEKKKKGTFLAHSQKIEPIKARQMYAACEKRGKKPARNNLILRLLLIG